MLYVLEELSFSQNYIALYFLNLLIAENYDYFRFLLVDLLELRLLLLMLVDSFHKTEDYSLFVI